MAMPTLSISDSSNTQITILWTPLTTSTQAGGSTITDYNIYWDQGSSTWTSISYSTLGSTVFTSLTAGTTYQFYVTAFNKYGESVPSPITFIIAA